MNAIRFLNVNKILYFERFYRKLLHLIVDAGTVVFNYNLQDRSIWIERLRHLKVFSDAKSTSKSYASQNRLYKSWIERHWIIWKHSL